MMPELETIVHQTGRIGPVLLTAAAVFLMVEAIFHNWSGNRRKKERINKRLQIQATTQNELATLVELRRRRGLTADGHFQLPFAAFNQIVMQSGTNIPIHRLVLFMAGIFIGATALCYTTLRVLPSSLFVGFVLGVAVPVLVLMVKRSRRLKLLENQLPEAIDVMVRSLKAGHPVPVAIAMVAREMSDPIGSEFGMAADEMTYGLDLEEALQNMRSRAGQFDLSFLVVAVSIQSKTGGNLAEILTNLSRMVRERARMRRKIRSLSSEGRFSAIALSVIPCALILIVQATAPSYFSDVNTDPLFTNAIYFGLMLWATGIYIMRRMVNFKF